MLRDEVGVTAGGPRAEADDLARRAREAERLPLADGVDVGVVAEAARCDAAAEGRATRRERGVGGVADPEELEAEIPDLGGRWLHDDRVHTIDVGHEPWVVRQAILEGRLDGRPVRSVDPVARCEEGVARGPPRLEREILPAARVVAEGLPLPFAREGLVLLDAAGEVALTLGSLAQPVDLDRVGAGRHLSCARGDEDAVGCSRACRLGEGVGLAEEEIAGTAAIGLLVAQREGACAVGAPCDHRDDVARIPLEGELVHVARPVQDPGLRLAADDLGSRPGQRPGRGSQSEPNREEHERRNAGHAIGSASRGRT